MTSHGSTTGNLILHNEKGLPGTGESRRLGTIFLKENYFLSIREFFFKSVAYETLGGSA